MEFAYVDKAPGTTGGQVIHGDHQAATALDNPMLVTLIALFSSIWRLFHASTEVQESPSTDDCSRGEYRDWFGKSPTVPKIGYITLKNVCWEIVEIKKWVSLIKIMSEFLVLQKGKEEQEWVIKSYFATQIVVI